MTKFHLILIFTIPLTGCAIDEMGEYDPESFIEVQDTGGWVAYNGEMVHIDELWSRPGDVACSPNKEGYMDCFDADEAVMPKFLYCQFWEHSNTNGSYIWMTPNYEIADLTSWGWNDRISSYSGIGSSIFAPHVFALGFEHVNFGGWWVATLIDENLTGGENDQFSSIRCGPVNGGAL